MYYLGMLIAIENPSTPDIMRLLNEHLQEMYATSPAESVHALDMSALQHPTITFWSARESERGELLGVGALKQYENGTAELKSMRTASHARGQGVAATILSHILEVAKARGITEVNLETGTETYFAAARRLYERHGFVIREPFADYKEDPHSVYYGLTLES